MQDLKSLQAIEKTSDGNRPHSYWLIKNSLNKSGIRSCCKSRKRTFTVPSPDLSHRERRNNKNTLLHLGEGPGMRGWIKDLDFYNSSLFLSDIRS
jgi:hypothetical protein